MALAFFALRPASTLAHPLGNFTINHYAGITVGRDRIAVDVVVDMAEIPAFQERQKLDTDGDGTVSDAETTAAAPVTCSSLARSLTLTVASATVPLVATDARITFPPGAGGLSTMRIECGYEARLGSPLPGPTTITFADGSYADRIGWREMVATGDGAVIAPNDLPPTSPSSKLTAYPTNLLTQAPDIRSATIVATPQTATVATPSARTSTGAAAAVPGGVGAELPAIFRESILTPLVAMASLLLAIALGAGHALTPGHGKTLMAAYLVGTRGTGLHAVGLGLSVAVSHTFGILALAALIVGAQDVLPPDVVARAAPVVAAISIVAIGGWMLASEIQRRVASRGVAIHGHAHGGHGHDDVDAGLDEHSHGGVRHSHLPAAASALSWRGLFALGLAGGLIPSTSALLILLLAIEAGRAAFGFVLVVAFGIGMAAVMTAVGLTMVFARSRLDRLPSGSGLGRMARHAPLVAAVIVFTLGIYLTVQAVSGRTVL